MIAQLPRPYITETLATVPLFILCAAALTACFAPVESGSWQIVVALLLAAFTASQLSKMDSKVLHAAFWIATLALGLHLGIPSRSKLDSNYLLDELREHKIVTSLIGWSGWYPLVSEFFIVLFTALGLIILSILFASRQYRWPAFLVPLAAIAFQYKIYYGIVGAVAALIFAILLFLTCNYGVKLLVDHRCEIDQFWRKLSLRRKLCSIALAAPAWGIVLILVIFGTIIHTNLADTIEETYREVFNIGTNSEELRLAQEDTLVGINRSERTFLEEMPETLRGARSESQARAASVPEAYSVYFERLRPSEIKDGPCGGWHFSVLGMQVHFRFLCRWMIGAINAQVQSSFNRVKQTTASTLQAKIDDLDRAGQATEAQIIGEVSSATTQAYEYLRRAVNGVFLAGTILGWIGAIVVMYSVLAAFLLATARVLFDDKRGQLAFRLVPPENELTQTQLQYSFHDELELTRNATSGLELVWYVTWSVKRSGGGAYSSFSVPKFWRCCITRLLTGRLSFCKLRFKDIIEASKPKISIPGDHKIVLVKVEGRELVFPMKNLLGFTEGVALRSGYSAHVGNSFLGLGMFYTFASGDGYIALLAHGAGVELASTGSSNSSQAFLLWDRRQEFALEQNPNALMWWINAPSIKVVGESSAIVDERPEKSPTVVSGILSVARFLFLPI